MMEIKYYAVKNICKKITLLITEYYKQFESFHLSCLLDVYFWITLCLRKNFISLASDFLQIIKRLFKTIFPPFLHQL